MIALRYFSFPDENVCLISKICNLVLHHNFFVPKFKWAFASKLHVLFAANSLTSRKEQPPDEDSSQITLYWSLLVEGRAESKGPEL